MKDKRNCYGTVGKSSSEQHFHKSAPITYVPLLCEIYRALHLSQPGLTTGWQADKIQMNFKIFKA